MGDFLKEIKDGVKDPEEKNIGVNVFNETFTEAKNPNPIRSEKEAKEGNQTIENFKRALKKYINIYVEKVRSQREKAAQEYKATSIGNEGTSKSVIQDSLKSDPNAQVEEGKEKNNEDKQVQGGQEKEGQESKSTEGTLDLEEKERETKKQDSNNIGYLDKVEMLRLMKQDIQDKQIKDDQYCADPKDNYNMLLFQRVLENERKEYIQDLDEEAQAKLLEIEEKNKEIELDKENKIMDRFNIKIEELNRLNDKMKELSEELRQIQKDMEEEKIDARSNKYKERMDYLNIEIMGTLQAIQLLNPKKLEADSLNKEKENELCKNVMGEFYLNRLSERSTLVVQTSMEEKDKKQSEQIVSVRQEIEKNDREGINQVLLFNRKHLEALKQEYDETPVDDIVKRTELLQEMARTNEYVEQYQNLSDDLDKQKEDDRDSAIIVSETEKDIEEKLQITEEEFKGLNAIAKQIETEEANSIVKDPYMVTSKEAEEGIEEKLDENFPVKPQESSNPFVASTEGFVKSPAEILAYDVNTLRNNPYEELGKQEQNLNIQTV